MKIKKIIVALAITVLLLSVTLILTGIGTFYFLKGSIDFRADEELFTMAKNASSSRFFYDGDPNTKEYEPVEILSSALSESRKLWYNLDDISAYVKEGIIAVEDRKFNSHKGVDFKRTVAAALNYIIGGDDKFGASTITQQVVKNISGDNEVSIKRKISEIIRAMHIENKYTKEEILEVYLNILPLSENIVGVGTASKYYFNKEPSALSADEAAAIIGITNAPSLYNPFKNKDNCINKRNSVLSVMHKEGVVDDEVYRCAVSVDTEFNKAKINDSYVNSWFVETVIEDLCEDLSNKYNISKNAAEIIVSKGGLMVYTTMDATVQKILDEYFANVDNFSEEIKDGLNYSFVVCDSKSNELKGIIGRVGKKSGNKLMNHALVNHIPGSTLKPLALYAPLLDRGEIVWSTVFDDVPCEFIEQQNGGYKLYPKNSPNRYDGLINLSDSIKRSKNTVAVKMYDMLGGEFIFDNLKNNYGFDSIVEKVTVDNKTLSDLSKSPLALGQLSFGIPLRKLTESYTVFPNQGVLREARSYLKVTDRNGKQIINKSTSEKRIMKKDTANVMNQLLSGVVIDGTAKSVSLNEIVDTAGKTGTSGNSYDKLFIGYTPYYTIGIWSGYDSNKKAVNCEPTHLDIWDDVARKIHEYRLRTVGESIEGFSTEGLKLLDFCYDSGFKTSFACEYDPRGERIDHGYFPKDYEINKECHVHILVDYDIFSEGIAGPVCPEETLRKVALLDIGERRFPCDIFITDGEFVYKEIKDLNFTSDYSVPYFYPWLDEGEFTGRSKKNKQFNSGCYIHY